ncbi:MAG TPA: DUF2384 domain-containing protein [Chromatiaceae bacterium]|nr:DUF2384 domain-containing protein [Chromatiaceae bacterium]
MPDPAPRAETRRSSDPAVILRTPTALLRERVYAGLPFAELEALRGPLGISLQELATLAGIPVRTLARRRQAGRLERLESERVLRIERLLALATEMLRDTKLARDWLTTPKVALGGHSPLAYADTEVGAREVEQLIGRLRHGVFC